MKPIDDKQIIEYIRKDPERLEQTLRDGLRDTLRRFSQIVCEGDEYQRMRDELLRANAMPGRSSEDSGGGHSSGGDPDRLITILFKTEQNLKDYRQALYNDAETMQRELAAVRRFGIVYRKVPAEWKGYLQSMYHDGEPWKVIVPRSGRNLRVFSEERAEILNTLVRLYNSTMTDAELAGMPSIRLRERGLSPDKPNSPGEGCEGQMSLSDFL